MNVKEIKGIAVVSITGGEKLGTVEDVIIDSQTRSIGAFKLQSGSLRHKEHSYVPFGAVRSIGADAIMIQTGDDLQSTFGERPSGYHTLGSIGNVKVVSEAGEFIGKLANVRFDTTTGAVTEFEVGKSGITGVFSSSTMIDAASVTTIGQDIMVVPDSFAQAEASTEVTNP